MSTAGASLRVRDSGKNATRREWLGRSIQAREKRKKPSLRWGSCDLLRRALVTPVGRRGGGEGVGRRVEVPSSSQSDGGPEAS